MAGLLAAFCVAYALVNKNSVKPKKNYYCANDCHRGKDNASP
jgi:hypothetical protein